VRALLADQRAGGCVARGAGARLVLTDVAVVGIAADAMERYGHGVDASAGATLEATRAWIADVRELGVNAVDDDTTLALTDVLVSHVRPSASGFGGGAFVGRGARATLARVAVLDVSGFALGGGYGGDRGSATAATVVSGDDVFVRHVGTSPVWLAGGRTTGGAVAYGLAAGARATLSLRRAVLANAGYGFLVAPDGALSLRDGVVTAHLDAAGVNNAGAAALVLERVARFGNANDDVLQNSDLPEVAVLPEPTPVCVELVCP
jgi:hypothetical protein